MAMYKTLLLDRTAWDLVLDSAGNIACAAPPYALIQDVASAVRTFLGECWYDTTLGIDYFGKILGQLPPASLLTSLQNKEALKVPGVVTASCTIDSFDSRSVAGTIPFTDELGGSYAINY